MNYILRNILKQSNKVNYLYQFIPNIINKLKLLFGYDILYIDEGNFIQ